MSKVSAIVVLLSFLSVASGFALAPQTRTSQLQSQQQLSMGLLDAFGLGKKPLTVSEEFGVPKPPNARYIYPKMPDTGERRRFFFSVAFLLSRSPSLLCRSLPHSVASLPNTVTARERRSLRPNSGTGKKISSKKQKKTSTASP
jgi:hypothetical protein